MMTPSISGPCRPTTPRRPLLVCLADPTYIMRDGVTGLRAPAEQLRLPLWVQPSYRDLLRHRDAGAALAELRARRRTARRRLHRVNRRTVEDAKAGRQFRDPPDMWVAAVEAAHTTRCQLRDARCMFRRRGVRTKRGS